MGDLLQAVWMSKFLWFLFLGLANLKITPLSLRAAGAAVSLHSKKGYNMDRVI